MFFTGSYATGKKIAQAVAGRMIKLQLEPGGKGPDLRLQGTSMPPRPLLALPTARFCNTGRAAARSSAFTCKKKIVQGFRRCICEGSEGLSRRRSARRQNLHRAFDPHRSPGAGGSGGGGEEKKKGASVLTGGKKIAGKVAQLVSGAHRSGQCRSHHGRDARGKFRPHHRHHASGR